jgi:hypothetical protein
MAVLDVSLNEPIRPGVNADTLAYSADNTIWPTADGGILEGATETVDAEVVAGEQVAYGAARYYRRRRPTLVYGYGDGELPRLDGEAHGIVGLPAARGEDEDEDDLLIALMLLAA